MARYASLAALALLLAACADSATAPATRPSGPSFDVGNPPPPRVNGSGYATLDVNPDQAAAGIQAAAPTNDYPPDPCMSHSLFFRYSSQYFENKPGNNKWLKIDPTVGKQVTIRQHGFAPNARIDANGTIVGPDFTFDITDALAGFLQGSRSVEGEGVFGSFRVDVKGIITEADGTSCPGTGTLSGFFGPPGFGGGG